MAAGEFSLILQLILKLLPMLKPDDLQKLKNEIERLEKERDEKKKIFIKALAEGDIPTLNALFSEFFGEL
jgi:formate dehydrogenase maturation protein FdhE